MIVRQLSSRLFAEVAQPYVAGTLLAVRTMREAKGVIHGFDRLMFGTKAAS